MGMWCAGQLKVGDSAVCMMRCDGGMLRTAKTYLLIPQGKARVGGNELPVGLLDRPLSAFLEKDTGNACPMPSQLTSALPRQVPKLVIC